MTARVDDDFKFGILVGVFAGAALGFVFGIVIGFVVARGTPGKAGGSCYDNGTCDAKLVCADGEKDRTVCVTLRTP